MNYKPSDFVKKELVVIAAKHDSKVVEEWQDLPKEGKTLDDWPYPDKHVKYRLDGPLARAIRRKVNLPYTADAKAQQVFIVETTVSGGYSEYTQEESEYIKVLVGGRTFMFGDEYSNTQSAFNALMEWLDK